MSSQRNVPKSRHKSFIGFAYFCLEKVNAIELRDDVNLELKSAAFHWTSVFMKYLFIVVPLFFSGQCTLTD